MTDTSDVSDSELESFQRFLRLFPHGADRTLVILKGHLLIEEQVRRIIDERVRAPSRLAGCHITFSTAICIAEALLGDEVEENLWGLVKTLNTIRNKLAHNIEPTGIDGLIAKFIDDCPIATQRLDETVRLELGLWALFVWVSEYVRRPSAEILRLIPKDDTP